MLVQAFAKSRAFLQGVLMQVEASVNSHWIIPIRQKWGAPLGQLIQHIVNITSK